MSKRLVAVALTDNTWTGLRALVLDQAWQLGREGDVRNLCDVAGKLLPVLGAASEGSKGCEALDALEADLREEYGVYVDRNVRQLAAALVREV